jgi:hypothetical protein
VGNCGVIIQDKKRLSLWELTKDVESSKEKRDPEELVTKEGK